jgi:plastocyanin
MSSQPFAPPRRWCSYDGCDTATAAVIWENGMKRIATQPGMATRLSVGALALVGMAVQAATLHITVSGADGRPAADAVVLVQPLAAAGGAASASPAAPSAPAVVVIEQKDFRFVPYIAVVPAGGSVRFVNKDPFDHHIRSLPGGPLSNIAPVRSIELRLAATGRSGDASEALKLDLPGAILLGCHLHGSMRGHVLAAATPFFAVTDERGRARVDGLPEGAVEMKLWHPDQLTEQAAQRLQLGPSLGAEAKLNFTPRRRPAPRADPSYGPPGSKD